MRTRLQKRRWPVILAAAVTVAALLTGVLYAQGIWGARMAIHIQPEEVESSTLAIGTHLIHLSALTDSLYRIAEDSAEESDQTQIYYKSELGGGAWFNITSAASLADITSEGTAVPDEEIERLFFTHRTGADRLTYDLRTGEVVNIFNIQDPYDLENLPQLAPLKAQYDRLQDLGSAAAGRIDQIWAVPVTGEDAPQALSEYEQALSSLQLCWETLAAEGADSRRMDQLAAVMASVDAGRRYEVLNLLEPVLSAYLRELGGTDEELQSPAEGAEAQPAADEGERGAEVFSALGGQVSEVPAASEPGENDPPARDPGEDGSPDAPDASGQDQAQDGDSSREEPPDVRVVAHTELAEAVSQSLRSARSALRTYAGEMPGQGETVMSASRNATVTKLLEHANAADYTACRQDLDQLVLLENILNDIIGDRPRELALLENTLLPDATARYVLRLSQGEDARYRVEVEKGSPAPVLSHIIGQYEGGLGVARGELEFLIEAECRRTDAQGALAFLDGRLGQANSGFAAAIPSGAFAESAQKSVEAHLSFLTDLRRTLEQSSGGNDMDVLMAEKQDLQTQRLAALDENDLARAKELEEQIAAVEEEIRAAEAEAAARISALQDTIRTLEERLAETPGNADLKNQLHAAKAELAQLEGSLSDGSLGAMTAKMKREALEGIAAGRDVKGTVDALCSMLTTDAALALPALQEIYNELLLHDGDQALISAIEQAILDAPYVLRNDPSAARLLEIAGGYLAEGGSGVSGLGGAETLGSGGLSASDAYDASTVILALQLYCDQTGSGNGGQLLAAMAQEQWNMGSPLIFARIQDSAGEYVPLTAVQAITGRRYIWNQNDSLAVLARGGEYYGFRLYSRQVLRDQKGDSAEEMARSARSRNGVVHIPEEYAGQRFDVQAVYLDGTNLGCAYSSAAAQRAQELLALFLAA